MQLQAVSSLLPPGQLFTPRKPQVPSVPVDNIPVDNTPAEKSVESPTDSFIGSDRFSLYSKYAGQAAGGALAANRLGTQTGEIFKEISKAFREGGKGMPQAAPGIQGALLNGVKGAGLGALVSAGVSLISNGLKVTQGHINVDQMREEVTDDAINGAFSGFGGVTFGGLGHVMMNSMGMVGLPLAIGTAAAGAVGGILFSQLSRPMEEEANATD